MSHFHEELCGCCSNIPVCLWAMCVPGGICCMQASAVSKATHMGACVPYMLICCLGVIGAAINRGKIRQIYEIEGSCCNDCCTWIWCGPCAACQEYKEANNR